MYGLCFGVYQLLGDRFVVSKIWRNPPIEEGESLWAVRGDHRQQLGGGDVEPRFEIHQHFRLEPFLQLIFTFAEGISLTHVQRIKLLERKLEIVGYKFNCAELGVVAFFAGWPHKSDMSAVFREFKMDQVERFGESERKAGVAQEGIVLCV